MPNPFADGETALWFHPECGVYKRPEPFLAPLGKLAERFEDAHRPRRRPAAGSSIDASRGAAAPSARPRNAPSAGPAKPIAKDAR